MSSVLALEVKGQRSTVNCRRNLFTFRVHRKTYSYHGASISHQQFIFSFAWT